MPSLSKVESFENCTMANLFREFFSYLFFPLTESETSEQASQLIATEEPNKGL